MAKKKTPVDVSPDNTSESNGKYHAVFTPTWRPYIDCGEHESIKAAQLAVHEVVSAVVDGTYYAAWTQVDENTWIATGHDGQVETTLPIATITRVNAE